MQMKHSKGITLLLAGVSAISLMTGCGSKAEAPLGAEGGSERNEEVYEGAVLTGMVIDYADGEFSVLAIQEETADDGGAIAIMPAPGSEGASNTTKVTYDTDCEFQIVKIDASREKAPEYQDAGSGDVQKLTEIIVFGEELSSGEVQADKVLISQIYNKDKMPGRY